MGRIILVLAFTALACISCNNERTNDPAEESATSGTLVVHCEATLLPIMEREVAAFDSMYPSAHITVIPTTATEAVIDLFTDKTKCIIVGRYLNHREEEAAKQYHIDLTTYSLAYSALAVIVNRSSQLKSISVDELKDRLQGKGGVLLSPTYSDIYALYSDSMLLAMGKKIATADSLEKLLRFVKNSSHEVVAVEWASIAQNSALQKNITVLQVSGRDSLGAEQKPVMLHQAYIYQKTYPLRKTLYGFTTAGNRSLAKGFFAFVTSAPGQRIVTNFGLVTTTMPVKLVSP